MASSIRRFLLRKLADPGSVAPIRVFGKEPDEEACGFAVSRLIFHSWDGAEISGREFIPHDLQSPCPWVVCIPAPGNSPEHQSVQEMKLGPWATLSVQRFVGPGNERQWHEERVERTGVGLVATLVRDALSAVQYLVATGRVALRGDCPRIAVVGDCFAGRIAWMSATVDDRIAAVVSNEGVENLRRRWEFRCKVQDYQLEPTPVRTAISREEFMALLAPRPFLLVHNTPDCLFGDKQRPGLHELTDALRDVYSRAEAEDRFALDLYSDDVGHAFTRAHAARGWLSRTLSCGWW